MSGRAVMRDRTFLFKREAPPWLRKVETQWPRLSVESNGEGVSEVHVGPFLPGLIKWAQASSPVAELQVR
jgi:hypothetical protein